MEPVEGKAEEERCTHFTGAGEVRAVYVGSFWRGGMAVAGCGLRIWMLARDRRPTALEYGGGGLERALPS